MAEQEEGRPSRWKDGLARSLVHGSFNPCGEQGLRGQPTYDGNGVVSRIARFRHPWAGVMPHAMDGEGEVSGFRRLGPLGPGVELKSYGAPKDGAEDCRLSRRMRCQLRRVAHGWVETVGAGAEKSGDF